jgi:hypothetical protein
VGKKWEREKLRGRKTIGGKESKKRETQEA